MLHVYLFFILACLTHTQVSGSFVNNICITSCQYRHNGQYLDCYRCNKYVMCSGGYLSYMPCPATTMYDGKLGVCVTRYMEGCRPNGARIYPLSPGVQVDGQNTGGGDPTNGGNQPGYYNPQQPYEPPYNPGGDYYSPYFPFKIPTSAMKDTTVDKQMVTTKYVPKNPTLPTTTAATTKTSPTTTMTPPPTTTTPTTTSTTTTASTMTTTRPAQVCIGCKNSCAESTKENPIIITCSDCCYFDCDTNSRVCP